MHGRAPKVKTVITRAVTVDKVRQFALASNSLSPRDIVHSMPSSSLKRGQSLGVGRAAQTDYELGKTYGQLDADQYYGGLRGEPRSGLSSYLHFMHQELWVLADTTQTMCTEEEI